MQRLFPTHLRVVSDEKELIEAEEISKGYFDPSCPNTLLMGVDGKDRIFMASPGNWWLYTTFDLVHPSEPANKLLNQSMMKLDESVKQEPETTTQKSENVPSLYKDDDYDGWRIVALIVKSECGRTALYKSGSKHRYITVTGINEAMAKQIYYLTKHTLSKLNIAFTVSLSIMSPFSRGMYPDIREKPKRKRANKKRLLLPSSAPAEKKWSEVVSGNHH